MGERDRTQSLDSQMDPRLEPYRDTKGTESTVAIHLGAVGEAALKAMVKGLDHSRREEERFQESANSYRSGRRPTGRRAKPTVSGSRDVTKRAS
jgi:hypothetical protein